MSPYGTLYGLEKAIEDFNKLSPMKKIDNKKCLHVRRHFNKYFNGLVPQGHKHDRQLLSLKILQNQSLLR